MKRLTEKFGKFFISGILLAIAFVILYTAAAPYSILALAEGQRITDESKNISAAEERKLSEIRSKLKPQEASSLDAEYEEVSRRWNAAENRISKAEYFRRYYEIRYGDDLYSGDGGGTVVNDNETISYSRKTVTSAFTTDGAPEYYNINASITNTCSPATGAMIVGFYDKIYAAIWSGVSPVAAAPDGSIYFKFMGTEPIMQETINTLYTMMGTNTQGPGTTDAQFRSGLNAYIAQRSRSVSYTSLVSGSSLDLSAFAAQINIERPIVLLCSGFNIIFDIIDNGSSVQLLKNNYSAAHMMLAYGYKQYQYYRWETRTVWKPKWYNPFYFETEVYEAQFRTDTYIKVSPARDLSGGDYYMLLESDVTLNNALAVRVY